MAFFSLISILLFCFLATIHTVQSETAASAFDYNWSITDLTATTLDTSGNSGSITTFAFTLTDGSTNPPTTGIMCNASFNGFPQSLDDNFECSTDNKYGFRFTWLASGNLPNIAYLLFHMMHTVQEDGVPQIRSGQAMLAASDTPNTLYNCSHFGTPSTGTICNKPPGQGSIALSFYDNGLAPDGWQGDPVSSSKRTMRRGARAEIASPNSPFIR